MISLVTQKQVASDCPVDNRLCKTLSIGRSSYYRGRCGRPDPDLELRDRIPKLALSWPSYANLVLGLNVTGLNQLWVADIICIKLAREWVYLAVVLDACSRRCIGWALDRNRSRIGYIIDKLYNRKRLHSALDYRPPAEIEQKMASARTVP